MREADGLYRASRDIRRTNRHVWGSRHSWSVNRLSGLATYGMDVAQSRAGPRGRADDNLPKVVKTFGPFANKHAIVLIYRSSCI